MFSTQPNLMPTFNGQALSLLFGTHRVVRLHENEITHVLHDKAMNCIISRLSWLIASSTRVPSDYLDLEWGRQCFKMYSRVRWLHDLIAMGSGVGLQLTNCNPRRAGVAIGLFRFLRITILRKFPHTLYYLPRTSGPLWWHYTIPE